MPRRLSVVVLCLFGALLGGVAGSSVAVLVAWRAPIALPSDADLIAVAGPATSVGVRRDAAWGYDYPAEGAEWVLGADDYGPGYVEFTTDQGLRDRLQAKGWSFTGPGDSFVARNGGLVVEAGRPDRSDAIGRALPTGVKLAGAAGWLVGAALFGAALFVAGLRRGRNGFVLGGLTLTLPVGVIGTWTLAYDLFGPLTSYNDPPWSVFMYAVFRIPCLAGIALVAVGLIKKSREREMA